MYSFNGKLKDDETYGNGNEYDFGARIYDPRLGRWLSVDPSQATYPELSPYNFTANNPIIFVDPNGKWISWFLGRGTKEYKEVFMSNGTGRVTWNSLVESQSRVIINVTNSVLVLQDVNGKLHLSGGFTSNVGELVKPLNGKAYFPTVRINVSLGTFAIIHAIEQSTGKSWNKLTPDEQNIGIQKELATGKYKVEKGDQEKGKTTNVKCDDYGNVDVAITPYAKPVPIENETEKEYMYRISVHEGTHGDNDAHQYYSKKTSESEMEKLPNSKEKDAIKEEKVERQKKD